jgi:hypothetical protein
MIQLQKRKGGACSWNEPSQPSQPWFVPGFADDTLSISSASHPTLQILDFGFFFFFFFEITQHNSGNSARCSTVFSNAGTNDALDRFVTHLEINGANVKGMD